MKIKMIETHTGYEIGEVYELDKNTATWLIQNNLAEAIDEEENEEDVKPKTRKK